MAVITSNTFHIGSYPFEGSQGPHAGYIVPEVLGAMFTDLDAQDGRQWNGQPWANEPARMPKSNPGGVQGQDLALIMSWASAWRQAERAGKHRR